MNNSITNYNFRARKWAELAGRDDLVSKRLENLTKYYLCSDHFTPEAFVNPNIEDKSSLRLNRLYSIPLPSVFEDNLMKNVKSVCQNPQKFVNYTRHSIPEKSTKQPLCHRSLKPINEASFKNEVSYGIEDDVEASIKKEVSKCVEDDEEYSCVELTEDTLEVCRADDIEPVMDVLCRLCATDSSDLIAIFNEYGKFSEDTECLNLMPLGLIEKDDGLPQHVCIPCLDKLQSCANTIDGFVLNQSLFSPE